MTIHTVKPHPLKTEIRKAKIRLWQIKLFLGGLPSEGTLCRMLNGLTPMSPRVERGIKRILDETKKTVAATK